MSDNQKKYEEAAKEYRERFQINMNSVLDAQFKAGASFAEKEAHNAAIDKAIVIVKSKNFNRWPFEEELEKLKI